MKVSRSQHGGEQYLALQSIARATGQGFEQLAVLYALEGFLRRLAASQDRDAFVLKGGVLLAAFGARRPTRDADLLALDLANDREIVEAKVGSIAAVDVGDGLVLELDSVASAFIRKAPAATVRVLTQAVLDLMQRPDHEVRQIGTRHGEKLYEALLSREEMAGAEDLGEYFRVPPDGRDLNYAKFVEQGEPRISLSDEYNSHNTERLDVAGMKRLLLKLDFMQRIVRGERAVSQD